VAAGILAFSGEIFASQAATTTGPGHLGEAALLLLFAYAGFENTAAAAGEYRNPRRDVPFALITQISLVTVLYVGVQAVALGTLPDLAGSQTPLADAVRGFLGSWAGTLLTVGAVLSILGTNGNTVFAGPRYLYALAADGYGPRALSVIHPRYRTPGNALLLHTALTIPLALSGTFVGLAALSVVARLATYLGTIAAVPVLRRRFAALDGTFQLPGGPAIPILAGLVTLALGASASPRNLIAAAVALAVGLVIYVMRRKEV
jgi:amino acid transporter